MSSETTSNINHSTIVCTSCESPITDLRCAYKCDTCSSDHDSNQDSAMSCTLIPIYCDICILPHIRKKHTVLDYKNMAIIVCDDHKLNCDKFCKTCDKLICFKCYDDHYKKKHSILSVEEKASEIKKVIHEALFENDKNYKPISAKLDSQKDSLAQICDVKANFSTEKSHIDLCEIIKEHLNGQLEIIEEIAGQLTSISDHLQNSIKDSETSLKDIDSNQTTLRSLLAFSDTQLVEQATKSVKLQSSLQQLKIDDDSAFLRETPNIVKQTINDARLSFSGSVQHALEKYFTDVKQNLNAFILQEQGIKIFTKFDSAKVISIASSDTILCIGVLNEDRKTIDVEFLNSLDERVYKRRITADHDCFKLFSCYGGIVVRFYYDTYSAFRTSNGKVTMSRKWKQTADVTGFIFNEESNTFIAYNINESAVLQIQSGYKNLQFTSEASGIQVSATIKFPVPSFAISLRSEDSVHLVLRHEKGKEGPLSSIGLPKFPSGIQTVKIEQSSTSLVAVGFDNLSGQFGLVKLDAELKPLQDAVDIKRIHLNKKINQEIYFNSSAYLVTEDGNILKIPNLLNIKENTS